MRTTALAMALLLAAAACGDPAQEARPSPEAPVPTSTTLPVIATVAPPAPEPGDPVPGDPGTCGTELPLFPNHLGTEVNGIPGPAPGSAAAEPGQVVAHWQFDYDVVIEMRWPTARDAPEGLSSARTERFEIWPAEPGEFTKRIVAFAQLQAGPCGGLTVEAFGPIADPAFDELYGFLDALTEVVSKAEVLAAAEAEVTPAGAGSERPLGRCRDAVVAEADEFGDVRQAAAEELVRRFLADRLVMARAEDCLTRSALAAYERQDDGHLPPLCLFDCRDGARLVAEDHTLDIAGSRVPGLLVSVLLHYELPDATVRAVREQMEVRAIDGRALVVDVIAQPESAVGEQLARRVIEDLLDAITAEQWEIAAGYLWNEGVSEEVERRLGDVWGRSPEELFTEFCREAACGAPYSIGETVAVDPWRRTIRVDFATTSGTVATEFRPGVFEGVVTADNLPPPGRRSGRAEAVDERLFGERYGPGLTVLRYGAAERTNQPAWTQWWALRRPAWVEAVGRWGALGVPGSDVEIVRLDGTLADPRHVATGEWLLAGAGHLDGAPVFFLTDGTVLDALDPATGERWSLLDVSGREAWIYGADTASGSLAVTMGIGDSTWVEIYRAAEPGAGPVATIHPDGAVNVAQLSPDGALVAMAAEEELHVPRSVVLADAGDGTELRRWLHGGPETVGRVDFDGRYIVAELWGDHTAYDPGPYGLLVIDVTTDEQSVVPSGVRVRFAGP